jgi:hypothetical protein
MKKLLQAFSYIFHPIFIPAYATLFYFLITRSQFYQLKIWFVFMQVLILTVFLPISIFYLLRSLGHIKLKVPTPKELRLMLAIYALLLLFLIKYTLSVFIVPEIYYYFVGLLISTVLALLLHFLNHKASLHMLFIASLTLFIVSISGYYHLQFINLIAFFVVCTGIVGSSRLQARAHSFGEVILGALLGIIPQVGLWFIWLLPSL